MQREDTKLIIYSAVGLIFGPIFCDLSCQFYKKLKRYYKFKRQGVKSVADIYAIAKSEPAKFKEKDSRFKTVSAFIEGSLKSDQPVYMFTIPSILVNYTRRAKSKLYQNMSYVAPPFEMSVDFNYNFYLHDKNQNRLKMPLYMSFSDELANLATLATENTVYHKPGLIKRTVLWVNNLALKFFNGLLNLRLSGYEIGIRDREYIVAFNSPLFMYATIYLDKYTGALSIRSAKFVNSTLEGLRSAIYDFKISSLIIWLISGVITYKVLNSMTRLLIFKYKRYSLIRKLQQGLSTTDDIEGVITTDNISCARCQEKPRNAMFTPCKDLKYCLECYHKWRSEGNNQCEVCHKVVVGKVDLIFS